MDYSPEEKISIETPEQVMLEFPLAGIGSRFLALATDTLIQILLGLLVLVAVLLLRSVSAVNTVIGALSGNWLMALAFVAIFLIHFGYFAFFESIWQGQTPGKRRELLRVIKDDGRPITPFEAIGRNLMRIVDGAPGMYGIGIVSMFFSKQSKRLGDYLAGTIVVHDKPFDRGSSLSFRTSEPVAATSSAVLLTADQFQLLEAYIARKLDLELPVRQKFAQQILDRLGATMAISDGDRMNPDALIDRLVNEYRNR